MCDYLFVPSQNRASLWLVPLSPYYLAEYEHAHLHLLSGISVIAHMTDPLVNDRDSSHKQEEPDCFGRFFTTEIADSIYVRAQLSRLSETSEISRNSLELHSITNTPSSATHPVFMSDDDDHSSSPPPLFSSDKPITVRLSLRLPTAFSFTEQSNGPHELRRSVDRGFLGLCFDRPLFLNPHLLHFIPSTAWTNGDVAFADLVTDFFQRKNTGNCRFVHKLYNALQITQADQICFQYIGVQWVDEIALKVDGKIFAQLLGIKSVDGGLFHSQGNFKAYGFSELTPAEADVMPPNEMLDGIDYEHVRLLMHRAGQFVQHATEETILTCTRVPTPSRVNRGSR
jgi:hypothetical protein